MDKILEVYSRAMSWSIFMFILIGHSPFHEPEDGVTAAAAGSATRQIVWLSLFMLSLPIIWHRRDKLLTLGRELYVFLFALGICWASVIWAISPQISLRRVILMTIILLVITGVTLAHRSVDSWITTLVSTTGIAMLVNWLGVLFLPHLAITELGWSGMHDHKNVAGGFTALVILIWLFAAVNARRPWFVGLYLTGMALWFLFLIGTQSKTSITLVVTLGAVGLTVELAARGGRKVFTAIAVTVPGIICLLAAGLIWLTPRKFLILTFGDPTMTGRTVIWRFMMRQIRERPIEGHGYGSFWMIGDQSPVVREGTGWFTGTTQGHNGYLDLAATIGLLGTTVFVLSLMFSLWTIGKIAVFRQAEGAARYMGLFVALICFALAHNMLESTFLRGGHFVWVSAYMSMILAALTWARKVEHAPVPAGSVGFTAVPAFGR